MNRAQIFRLLPSILMAWFQIILYPAMQRMDGQQRNERESRTLVEAIDGLLRGDVLPVIVLLLGRLKAIASVVLQEGSWALAQNHEVVRSNQTGLLTERDLRNAQRDLRDQQRLAAGGRGAPYPSRQSGG